MSSTNIKDYPIYVDLDGTLVKTDIAQELLIKALVYLPGLYRLVKVFFSGRSFLKRFLAENYEITIETLPFNDPLISYLKEQKNNGRRIILATAADMLIASKIANFLGIFDDVIASTPGRNLKGGHKLEAINAFSSGAPFEYIGDTWADKPIWNEAKSCGFVNAPNALVNDSHLKAKTSYKQADRKPGYKVLLQAMRPHQWAKNLLVFVPLFFSHSYFQMPLLTAALFTFIAISFAASGIYLINDLLDIESDRLHHKKRNRAFAAGLMLPFHGVVFSVILLVLSISVCLLALNLKVLMIVLAYIVITNLYSFYLKRYSTIDVITLTILFTIRIFAGGVAIGVAVSPWLLNFSMFFFLSLAYIKRYIELSSQKDNQPLSGRGYAKDEMDTIQMIGICCGGLAVLTFSLYINSEFVMESYASPELLWFICPLLLFWIFRAWMWTKRGWIHSDPVVFAVKDRISLATACLIGFMAISAKFFDLKDIPL